MKAAVAVLALAAAAPVFAAEPHPFNVHDLVMMERVSAPVLSPDGSQVAYALRQTDYEANKGSTGIWRVPVRGGTPVRLTPPALHAYCAMW